MRIMVTGATGRVGSRFVPRLLERGDQVRVVVRHPEQADFLGQLGAEVVKGDLLEPETLPAALDDVEAVVHLAAFFRGATPEQAHATNLEGTVALAQAILKAGISRLVFASTNLVYGPGRGRPLNEDDEPRPVQAYPVSKFAAEQALQELQRSEGLGLTILRLPFVYGDGDPHLAELLPMVRSWPLTRRFQMGHHRDVAQALMLALETSHTEGRVYNVADSEPVTIAEIRKLDGEPVDESEKAFSLPVPPDSWEGIVDTSRIQKELGFRPIYPNLKSAIDAKAL
ncbi:MAG TPA: NAD(P)-dependent oxidoreductase [Chloroflexia bacterium]|nr:NAD(P)-dependent oxidoreductase [Chloroflexia bacterium]